MAGSVIPANVVIFGETGAGKSSIINLIAGDTVAIVSSTARGCTFESKSYDVNIGASRIRLWDTAGLNEGDQGTMDANKAIIGLYHLTNHLQSGVSLLVYCMSRGRITRAAVKNYQMFCDGVCQRQVPVVLVVTGLEQHEPNMEAWWLENAQTFLKDGMVFAGHACITATKGKKRGETYLYAEEYEESRIATRELIRSKLRTSGPWKLEKENRVAIISKTAYNYLAGWLRVEPCGIYKALHEVLQQYGDLTPAEAAAIANETVLDAPANVIVFGETGAGKSSVINMIAGREVAKVANTAQGCTFGSIPHDVNVGGMLFRLWDTAGLNENEEGSVAAKDAIVSLYKLMEGLDAGISLLVYCVRGRIKETTVKNYKLFYEGFCQKEVPIVVVVTGLELEEPEMDSWWERNILAFRNQGMEFVGHACVTATKGRNRGGIYMFAGEYETSQNVTRNLIREEVGPAWMIPKTQTIKHMFKRAYNLFAGAFGLTPLVLCQILFEVLTEHGGFSSEDARNLANQATTDTSIGEDDDRGSSDDDTASRGGDDISGSSSGNDFNHHSSPGNSHFDPAVWGDEWINDMDS